MRTVARAIYKLGDIIEALAMKTGMLTLTASLGILIYIIFLRKFAAMGISWGDEAVKYLALWGVFLGTGLATRYKTHIVIDILVSRWTGMFSRLLLWAGLVLGLGVSSYLTFLSVQYILLLYRQGAMLTSGDIPQWIASSSFLVACAMLAFYYIEQIIEQAYPRERLGLPPLRRPGGEG